MTYASAPFHRDVAEAPDQADAYWLTAADGVRLRAVVVGGGASGTVLLFPGRTEYAEKYGPAAEDLLARGYSSVTIDWRGQGLADRPLPDRQTGHVREFVDYQKDIAAALDLVDALRLPKPLFLMAHSMGGAIGLRALYRGLPVRAAAFSAPMWGIRISASLRPVAWALSGGSRLLGQGHKYAPGTTPVTYVAEAPFTDNVLTTDPDMYAFMQRQVRKHTELSLGGPSLHWLNEALLECRSLARKASPDVPCYTALGTRERVVDTAPIHDRMSRWPGGMLDMIEGAEHEVMMEKPSIRALFYDRACALFDKYTT